MTANEVRKKFLDFFKSKKHTIVASDSVVPKNDPTVLFTTAGMQQFKQQFLGHIDGYTRAASSQKCIRTDDLDEVGNTDFHHTFFEMLGNFSFGDYFKKEAIEWGWEFLTKELKIPADRLWVSVYKDDKEAEGIWLKTIKVPKERLIKLGAKSNFWPANAKENGPNGPCGPCSEIFYDHTGQSSKKNSNPDTDPERFAEVWNLVFTQFDRKQGGTLEPLPNKNIDTGMGLERLAAVMQDKINNFETDLFTPIIEAIDKQIDKGKLNLEQKEKYIIADHIRAIVFAINDGVIPSNKERGFVIKGLINSSTNIVLSRGAAVPTIYKLVPTVIEAMKHPYPELQKNEKSITQLIQKNEEAFISVRKQRIPELKEGLTKVKNAEGRGELYFKFRDTYGLPLKTIIETARAAGVTADKDKNAMLRYQKLMKEQQDRSRASSKISGDVFTGTQLDLDVKKTNFTGYSNYESKSKIIKVFIGNDAVKEAKAGNQVKIILDTTPFYAEAGGQVSDTGEIVGKNALAIVTDTEKINDIYIHSVEIKKGTFKVGDSVEAKINTARRLAIMRNHTATHILQAALRDVLGTHVQQQGSLVAEDRLRFDFTHPQAIKKEEIKQIEDVINARILNNDSVKKEEMPIEKARKSGALAYFAEKYGNTVRVVSINEYSKEFCGGTHLDSTGQIGLLKIVSEGAIAQGIRRLEAKTGKGAMEFVGRKEAQLEKIAQTVKAPADELVERISTQTRRIKQLEKELEKYRFKHITAELESIIKKAKKVGNIKLIINQFDNIDASLLRKIADSIKQKEKSSIVVLGAKTDQNAVLLVGVSEKAIKEGIKANELINELAPLMDGSGGGNPKMAQAGSKSVNKLNNVIQQAEKIIKDNLK